MAGVGERPPGDSYHAVLRVQHLGLVPVTFKEGRLHAKALAEIIVDYRPQLLMVPKQNNLEYME